MKWSWKSFGLQFVTVLVLGCIFTFAIRLWIDGKGSAGAHDLVLFSMGLAGLFAPVVPAAISGWKGWALKPLLVACVIVSGLLFGNPGGSILGVVVGAICYSTARKVRAVAFYYSPAEKVTPDTENP